MCRGSITRIPYSIAELLPQSGEMILLDEVLEIGDGFIVTELSVRGDSFFADADHKVPAWIGIEYMAQTVAAYFGYRRKSSGQTVDLGFLLGTRYYESSVDDFPAGSKLRVRGTREIEGLDGLSVFDCAIEGENIRVTARLNVFVPADSSVYLAERGR